MPIRDLFKQLSKRLGRIGGTETSNASEERSTEAPTVADLDAAVASVESSRNEQGSSTASGGVGAPAGTNDVSADGERTDKETVPAGIRETMLAEASTRSDAEGSAGAGRASTRSNAEGPPGSGEAPDRGDVEARRVTDGEESKSNDSGVAAVDSTASESGAERTDVAESGERDRADGNARGPVECRIDGCDQTFATAHGMKIHATKVHGEDVKPPHRDPERLREVYEAHDTFTEMTEALEVEVTPQTVRRSMAALGIHDPEESTDEPAVDSTTEDEPAVDSTTEDEPAVDSTTEDEPTGNPTAEDESAGNPVTADESAGNPVTADEPVVGPSDDGSGESEHTVRDGASSGPESRAEVGSGTPLEECERIEEVLPEDVEGAELIAAIEEARTLYEVQRALGIDRPETQALLAELDLLDLVQCRLATKPDPADRRAEIERRLGEGVDA